MIEIRRILNKKVMYVSLLSFCLCLIYFTISCIGSNSKEDLKKNDYYTEQYVEYIEGYESYITNIMQNAEKTKAFSAFMDDKFVIDNIEKTYSDYSRLVGVKPVCTNTLGFDKYISYIPVISGFVFFIMLYCLFNTQKEYENGEIVFSYSSRNGRLVLAFRRNILYTVMAIILTFVFNAFILLLSGVFYGFPDFLLPVQSSILFADCTSRVSILEFLLINVFENGIGISVLALFSNLLFNVIRNKYVSFVVAGSVLLGEYRLSLLLQNNSYKRFLANINIFKVINFSTYYINYQNINMFGKAVSSLELMLVVAIILYLIFFSGSVIAYTYRRPFSKIRFGKVKSWLEIQGGRIISECNFVGFELYKIFIRKKKFILIIILILIEVFLIKETRVEFPERQLLMDNVYSQYGGADWESFENYLNEYRNIIEDKKNEVIELNSELKEKEDAQNNIRNISRLSAEITEMETILSEYDEVVNYKNEVESYTGITTYAMSDRGYNEIFGKNSWIREMGIMIITVLISVILGSGYYLEEFQSRFVTLVRSSKQGLKETFAKKLWIILSAVFILISVFIVLDYVELNRLYGFKYLDAPIVSLKFMGTEISSIFNDISIGQYLIIDILLKIIVPMVTLAITLLCSLKFKTLFFVPIVVFLASLGGYLSIYAGITVKVLLIICMAVFLVCAISYIIKGRYVRRNV